MKDTVDRMIEDAVKDFWHRLWLRRFFLCIIGSVSVIYCLGFVGVMIVETSISVRLLYAVASGVGFFGWLWCWREFVRSWK